MNPAALKANLGDLHKGAAIIVDSHDFTERNLTKASYTSNPLDALGEAGDAAAPGSELGGFSVFPVDLTGMTVEAVKEFGLSRKDAARAKNTFALGLQSWMYGRPTETTIDFLSKRFAKVEDIRDASRSTGWPRSSVAATPGPSSEPRTCACVHSTAKER
jgi:2-oxoglutarate ferredoxin oxidoreductase subunit alpha